MATQAKLAKTDGAPNNGASEDQKGMYQIQQSNDHRFIWEIWIHFQPLDFVYQANVFGLSNYCLLEHMGTDRRHCASIYAGFIPLKVPFPVLLTGHIWPQQSIALENHNRGAKREWQISGNAQKDVLYHVPWAGLLRFYPSQLAGIL